MAFGIGCLLFSLLQPCQKFRFELLKTDGKLTQVMQCQKKTIQRMSCVSSNPVRVANPPKHPMSLQQPFPHRSHIQAVIRQQMKRLAGALVSGFFPSTGNKALDSCGNPSRYYFLFISPLKAQFVSPPVYYYFPVSVDRSFGSFCLYPHRLGRCVRHLQHFGQCMQALVTRHSCVLHPERYRSRRCASMPAYAPAHQCMPVNKEQHLVVTGNCRLAEVFEQGQQLCALAQSYRRPGHPI